MAKSTIRLLGLSLFYVAFLGPTVSAFAKDVVFNYASYGFAMNVPDSWNIQYPPGNGVNGPAVLVATPDGGISDPFVENCNVMIGSWPQRVDEHQLRIAHDQGQAGVRRSTRGFVEVEQGETSVGPLLARWSISTFIPPGAPEEVKSFGYMIASGTSIYSVICTALPRTFPQYEAIFRGIAESFRVLDK